MKPKNEDSISILSPEAVVAIGVASDFELQIIIENANSILALIDDPGVERIKQIAVQLREELRMAA